ASSRAFLAGSQSDVCPGQAFRAVLRMLQNRPKRKRDIEHQVTPLYGATWGAFINQNFSLDKRIYVLYSYAPFGPIAVSLQNFRSGILGSRGGWVADGFEAEEQKYAEDVHFGVGDSYLRAGCAVLRRERSVGARCNRVHHRDGHRFLGSGSSWRDGDGQ